MTAESVIYAISCGSATILLTIPFLWQVRKRNVAASLLVFWLQSACLLSTANAIIWPDVESTYLGYQGEYYCDFVAKWKLASEFIGVNCSVLCVMITIYRMFWSTSMYRETRRSRRFRTWYEWGIAGVFPLVLAAAHYVVQPYRYNISPVTGCSAAIDNSWVSLIIYAWPLVFSIISLVLVILIVWKLQVHMKNRSFLNLFASSSQLDASFQRLYLVVALFTFIYFPSNLWGIIRFCITPMLAYDWEAVHYPEWWSQYWQVPDDVQFQYTRWMKVISAWILFIIFGRGGEATAIYWDIAEMLHLSKETEVLVNKYQSFKNVWLPSVTQSWISKTWLSSQTDRSQTHSQTQSMPGPVVGMSGILQPQQRPWKDSKIVQWIQVSLGRREPGMMHLGSKESFEGISTNGGSSGPAFMQQVRRTVGRIGRPKVQFQFNVTWIRDPLYNTNPVFNFSRYRLDVPENPAFCETFDATTLEAIAKHASSEMDSVVYPTRHTSSELTRVDTSFTYQGSILSQNLHTKPSISSFGVHDSLATDTIKYEPDSDCDDKDEDDRTVAEVLNSYRSHTSWPDNDVYGVLTFPMPTARRTEPE